MQFPDILRTRLNPQLSPPQTCITSSIPTMPTKHLRAKHHKVNKHRNPTLRRSIPAMPSSHRQSMIHIAHSHHTSQLSSRTRMLHLRCTSRVETASPQARHTIPIKTHTLAFSASLPAPQNSHRRDPLRQQPSLEWPVWVQPRARTSMLQPGKHTTVNKRKRSSSSNMGKRRHIPLGQDRHPTAPLRMPLKRTVEFHMAVSTA